MKNRIDRIYNDDEETPPEKIPRVEMPDPLVSKFMKTRQILLAGEVNKDLSEKIVRQLLVLESESKKPIHLFIDSPGGDVDAGYAIFDMIRFIGASVWTIGMGLVASAGALILLAAPRERRIALPNSHYLIHQPLGGYKGVATDIEIHALEIEKMRKKINVLIAAETGKPLEVVEKDTDRDHWLNAAEAMEYGLVSRIAEKRADLG
ncbi:MAG: ATP-dependent Clp protease proteolytic subunit [Spirochaetaceae bacterium]|nr:ATP-dependent Clp protease proteolytic subunit [Spirochaetaceae bacterium]